MDSTGKFEGIDAAWLASDEAGLVAVFTSGGEGTVPEAAVPSVSEAEREGVGLPERSGCKLHSSVPRPDDFVAFAMRGFFAYDWSDVHRTNLECLGRYELHAEPSVPASLTDLPISLQRLVVRLPGVSFGSNTVAVGT